MFLRTMDSTSGTASSRSSSPSPSPSSKAPTAKATGVKTHSTGEQDAAADRTEDAPLLRQRKLTPDSSLSTHSHEHDPDHHVHLPPTPLLIPLREYQTSALLFAAAVVMATSIRIYKYDYQGLWYDLHSPDHLVHQSVAKYMPWIVTALCAVIAFYTTWVKAGNKNALSHAAQRIAVNVVYGALVLKVLANVVDLPISLPLAQALHSVLVLREESLVWVRQSLHIRHDLASAKAAASHASPDDIHSHVDDHFIKDGFEWFLFFTNLGVGLACMLEILVAAFGLYESHGQVFVTTVAGYAGWWLHYVQWLGRPGAPWRVSMPGNFNDYKHVRPGQHPLVAHKSE
ncbi:hypothetical protein BCR44DRAFT_328434 [Catenaria anguillulae PL171]|uniref:Uncharacterized protein n=1 Tax=Catenaria anguillulae PL171 TaxID=765915 RepID=A0A1Y2H683_9FUNG|nr:hypothetical protein BCR44DRAFT_328434 [Catenaria anguillulae PL171]